MSSVQASENPQSVSPRNPEPSDEELREIMRRARERAGEKALGLFAPVEKIDATTALSDDLSRLAESFGPEQETWRPTCVRCGEEIGYAAKRGSYAQGKTECVQCRAGGVVDRLTASGISFREIDQPLSALKNHDPDGKPYGADYDRWLSYLNRFAALKPGERLEPPFAFVYGSNGVGKSAGAERALRDAIRNGCAGRVESFRELVRRITSTYGAKDVDERADAIVRTYCGVHLLVIQEVGLEDHTDHNYGLFFDFVDERWRAKLPTIFTSNYSPDSGSLGAVMTERTADETKMRAILDRIRGGIGENLFVLRGKSWRGHE